MRVSYFASISICALTDRHTYINLVTWMCNYARLDIGVACVRYIIAFFACNKSISGHSLTNFCYLCVVGREKSVDCKRHLAWFFILKSPI